MSKKKKKKKIKNYLSSALAAMRRGEAYIGKVLIQREVVRKCSHVLLQKLLLWWIGCLLTVFSASFESCMSVLKHFLESSLGLQSPLVVFFFLNEYLDKKTLEQEGIGIVMETGAAALASSQKMWWFMASVWVSGNEISSNSQVNQWNSICVFIFP